MTSPTHPAQYIGPTIAAIATAPGAAGVGIVRLSGDSALEVLRRVFPAMPEPPVPRALVFGNVVEPNNSAPIDFGYAVWLPGPRSFTGEDIAELQVHGGSANLRRVLRAVLDAGARVADPGEFTQRAFLNGKLDLAQAEALLDVVHARTEAGLAAAHRHLAGDLKREVEAIKAHLVRALAYLELNIDFVEEDVPLHHNTQIANALAPALDQLQLLLASFNRGRLLREGFSVALAGRPNAGKSSLFNALLRDGRAIVTAAPGTTRDFLEERADIAGIPVVLVDTAGLRDTTEEAERQGVERSYARINAADVALWVADGSQPPSPQDEAEWNRLPPNARLAVLNKSDLPEHSHWAMSEWATQALRISARTGSGIQELESTLANLAETLAGASAGGPVVMRERQRLALSRCYAACQSAQEALQSTRPPEIAAGEIQLALSALADLIGATTPDEVLGHIFKEFCIGK